MTFLLYLFVGLLLFVCTILILLVLIQKGRGGGLASAFGGGGGNTAFGSKTGDVLTWATSVVFGVFLMLAVAVVLVGNRVQENYAKTILNGPVASSPPALPSRSVPAAPVQDQPASVPPTPPVSAPQPAAQPSTQATP